MVYTADLKSAALRLAGSSPASRTKIPRFRITDNTVGFYPTNVGSIPAGETSCWAVSSCWLEQWTHNPLVLCSTHRQPTKFMYA